MNGDGMEGLTPQVARRIIATLGSQGIPPEYGFQYFTEGMDEYLEAIDEDYLSSFVPEGGSAFKMVVSPYGGGKTHFLYSVRELAWRRGHMASYIVLSPESTPFHRLEAVYRAIACNLVPPQSPEALSDGPERGIGAVIERWYLECLSSLPSDGDDAWKRTQMRELAKVRQCESMSFTRAIREAFLSLVDGREEDFARAVQWLEGEPVPKSEVRQYGIYDRLERGNAFKMIRSLVSWVRDIGYSGLVILLDEAEQTSSMTTRQRDQHLQHLREVIDATSRSDLGGTMWLYAVPDESFLEGRSLVYEALRQRLDTVFDETNPYGIKIRLEEVDDPQGTLIGIGMRIATIYEVAHGDSFDEDELRETMSNMAADAYDRRFESGYRRTFVQSAIAALGLMHRDGGVVTAGDLTR